MGPWPRSGGCPRPVLGNTLLYSSGHLPLASYLSPLVSSSSSSQAYVDLWYPVPFTAVFDARVTHVQVRGGPCGFFRLDALTHAYSVSRLALAPHTPGAGCTLRRICCPCSLSPLSDDRQGLAAYGGFHGPGAGDRSGRVSAEAAGTGLGCMERAQPVPLPRQDPGRRQVPRPPCRTSPTGGSESCPRFSPGICFKCVRDMCTEYPLLCR